MEQTGDEPMEGIVEGWLCYFVADIWIPYLHS